MASKSKTIKIAIPSYKESKWLGGKNYINNLIYASNKIKNIKHKFVYVSYQKTRKKNVIYCKYLDKEFLFYRYVTYFRYLCILLFNKDFILDSFFKKKKIDVVSHLVPLGSKSSVKSISWIPDFQVYTDPDFFPIISRMKRRLYINFSIKNCNHIILSSKDALKNYKKFINHNEKKVSIIQFATKSLVRTKYKFNFYKKIPKNFYLVANQFWKHKNHITIFKSISYLKSKNIKINIVCTGNINDNRWKNHSNEIQNFIEKKKLGDRIFLLGSIDKKYLDHLFFRCKAIINPSFSEGWNTAVEEAKSIGKRTILSNIRVHKEQDKNGIFFNTRNYKDLAKIMVKNWNSVSISKTKKNNYKNKTKEFGDRYLKLVSNIISIR